VTAVGSGVLARATGSLIAGYRIDALVGGGRLGVVYRATDVALERPVALKLVEPMLGLDASLGTGFPPRLEHVALVEHPNVIPVHHAGEEGGTLFVAMRYVAGIDLGALIAREGALHPRRVADIVHQVAEALDAAHAAGVVHRDVKPSNVLIENLNGREHVFLTDFGLSKQTASAAMTATNRLVGTLDYVAPEQIGGRVVDGRADVYALGCVLFHALTGQAPYALRDDAAKLWGHMYDPPPSVSEVCASAPAALDAVVSRAMAKRPDDRYASAGELGRAAVHAVRELRDHPVRERHEVFFSDSWPTEAGEASDQVAGDAPVAPRGAPGSPPASSWAPPSPAGDETDHPQPLPVHGTAGCAPPSAVGHGGGQQPSAAIADRRRRRPIVLGATLALLAAAIAVALTVARDDAAGESGASPPTARTIAVGAGPAELAVTRDAVWVANRRGGSLTRIDTRSDRTREVRAADKPGAVAVGEGALWSADESGRLDRRDPESGKRLGRPRVLGTDVRDVATGAGSVWVANGSRNTVTRLRAGTGTAAPGSPITVGKGPRAIAVRAGTAWVVNAGADSVTRIDTRTSKPVGQPIHVAGANAIAAGEGSVWVTGRQSNAVTRIDPRTGTVVGRPIAVSRAPSAVAVGAGAVWVTSEGDDTLTRIDARTAKVVGSPIAVGRAPSSVAVGPDAVWVANRDGNSVTRVSLG
jgi:serine/threonine protein kinase/streptogramin lyase